MERCNMVPTTHTGYLMLPLLPHSEHSTPIFPVISKREEVESYRERLTTKFDCQCTHLVELSTWRSESVRKSTKVETSSLPDARVRPRVRSRWVDPKRTY